MQSATGVILLSLFVGAGCDFGHDCDNMEPPTAFHVETYDARSGNLVCSDVTVEKDGEVTSLSGSAGAACNVRESHAAYEPGKYLVRATSPDYAPATADVTVPGGDCGVTATAKQTLFLEPL